MTGPTKDQIAAARRTLETAAASIRGEGPAWWSRLQLAERGKLIDEARRTLAAARPATGWVEVEAF